MSGKGRWCNSNIRLWGIRQFDRVHLSVLWYPFTFGTQPSRGIRKLSRKDLVEVQLSSGGQINFFLLIPFGYINGRCPTSPPLKNVFHSEPLKLLKKKRGQYSNLRCFKEYRCSTCWKDFQSCAFAKVKRLSANQRNLASSWWLECLSSCLKSVAFIVPVVRLRVATTARGSDSHWTLKSENDETSQVK